MKKYLGHLPESDPLYSYLQYEIQPQLTGFLPRPVYRVFRLNASNAVYLYEERHGGSRMIGKFFQVEGRDSATAARKLGREEHNLHLMRGLGLTAPPHYIARPLGRNEALNKLLVIEFCQGELLSALIRRAIREDDSRLLFDKLTALAWFLADFHNRAADAGAHVDFAASCAYFDTLVARLLAEGVIGGAEAGELYFLRDRWREQPKMWQDRRVLAHGDATPENFLFGNGVNVMSFDLERLRWTDRVFDTGRIAGELAHFFLEATGAAAAAEPFIGHFLWEYACHFPGREQAFLATTRRVPFYMAMTFLRIARNHWLPWEYRRRLARKGRKCLRGFAR
ncbi:MAG: aminoglycoside phosphotransferase family protein [Desulfobulbaceae bacterium]|nr:aminoglycoside phosphotransferase family protein [Desulfobulbaceae bacterium]